MARPTPLSGFPEWLPAGRLVEQHVIDTLRHTFELHGFAGIETRAVEPVSQLVGGDETSKEIYTLRRLGAEDAAAEARLGLHFDLTVPLARYVLEHSGALAFPFKRYQIQKVWRGERPQDGRFREFLQADIDVIGADTLPFHFEVELPLVMAEALTALPIPAVRISVNNRKLAEGFYSGIGLTDTVAVLRTLDKLGKIGPEAVAEQLAEHAGASPEQATAALGLAGISGGADEVEARVRALDVHHPLLEEGLAELVGLLRAAERRAPGVVVGDLSVARGLDYYTGSVYETTLLGHEDLGSICSGGRYDSLATDGRRTFPGVGLSIGVSRLVSRLLSADLVDVDRSVPTAVLVAVVDEDARATSDAIAARLRARGIPADVSPSAAKYGKQIRHAERRGIPYVWFPGADGDEVKDIRSQEQQPADVATWSPPAADLRPRIRAAGVSANPAPADSQPATRGRGS